MRKNALIAIVDDDEPFRVAMEGLIRSLGYRAVAFPSAETFLGSVLGRSADCVVSDIQMPGMNGFEMKQRMDQDGAGAGVIFASLPGRGCA